MNTPGDAALNLQTSTARLTLGADGGLRVARRDGAAVLTGGGSWWRAVLQEPSQPWRVGPRAPIAPPAPPQVTATPGRLALHWPAAAGQPLGVRVNISIDADGFAFTAEVVNHDPLRFVREFAFPVLEGVRPPAGAALLWPNGLGERCPRLGEVKRRTIHYPSGTGTMPWFAWAGASHGLYLGCHDPVCHSLRIETGHVTDAAGDLTAHAHFMHHPDLAPGASWRSPTVVLRPYDGAWPVAAATYRAWWDNCHSIAPRPDWVRDCTGWLLAVLKQQNGAVMWDYRTGIDALVAQAKRHGLSTLALFGWAQGGHDRGYPQFVPDPAMGGRDALTAALARARAADVRTILYAQGQLIDTATDFYQSRGNDVIALRPDSEPYIQSIRKFHSSGPVVFAIGCNGEAAWRDHLTALAEHAHALGADGILFDQLGVVEPYHCHSTRHEHARPADAYARCRVELLRHLAEHMERIDPRFIVTTEGVFDELLAVLPMFHGWGRAAWHADVDPFPPTDCEPMPELFRATFPELVMSQRHPTPAQQPRQLHFALLHGLRPEIELRYPADVRYLRDGVTPTRADYDDVSYYPPSVDIMRATTAADSAERLATARAFVERHAGLLRDGRYVVEPGVSVDGPSIAHACYRRGDDLAVVLVNESDQERTARATVAGHTLQARYAPDPAEDVTRGVIPPWGLLLEHWRRNPAP